MGGSKRASPTSLGINPAVVALSPSAQQTKTLPGGVEAADAVRRARGPKFDVANQGVFVSLGYPSTWILAGLLTTLRGGNRSVPSRRETDLLQWMISSTRLARRPPRH